MLNGISIGAAICAWLTVVTSHLNTHGGIVRISVLSACAMRAKNYMMQSFKFSTENREKSNQKNNI